MKAMIVAAGLGTRLKPLTDTMPKALVPVAGKPLLGRVIDKLIAGGITELVINLHHFPEQIVSYVEANNSFGIPVHFSDESDGLLETGGGIRKARTWLETDEPFLVHNVDILSNLDIAALLAQHQRTNPLATLVVSERDTFRYFLFDDDLRLRGWTNLKTGEVKPRDLNYADRYRRLAFSGIQVLSPKIFRLMDEWPERFSITDFYLEHLKENTSIGYLQDNYRMIDVGKIETLKDAEEFVR
jgi:NDP-sugar pyrophosphorylase family protein